MTVIGMMIIAGWIAYHVMRALKWPILIVTVCLLFYVLWTLLAL